jgi:ABC-type branched-subunit amino acid transport system ATPase component
VVLEVIDVAVRFGGVAALDGLSFDVERGEILGIIGPNGAGKTTLLNVISGFVRPNRGSVRLDGADVLRRPPAERARRGLGRTFQTPRLFPGLTLAQNLDVTRRQRRRAGTGLDSVEEVLAVAGLADLRDVTVEHLTAGERRFAEVARALMLRPVLLLLDEPATGLHDPEIHQLGRLLKLLGSEHDLTSLLISHNMTIVNDCCARVIAMDVGRLLATGTPSEVRNNPAVVAAYFGSEENVA